MLNKGVLFLMAFMFLMHSCKSRRKKHYEKPPTVVFKNDSASQVTTASDLLSFTLKPWTYFSSKIDVEIQYDDGKKINPNVHIRMYKDSLIWLSGGMFGIEGMRMLINKDSMVVLNKLEKKYTVYKNTLFKGVSDIPLSITQLQNLILGKPVYALELYKIVLNNENRLGIEYSQEKFNTSHSYQRQFFTIDTTFIRDKFSSNYAEARYLSYSVVNDYNFPVQTVMTATNGQKVIQIDLKYSDMDFISPLTFPFLIPSSYEKTK